MIMLQQPSISINAPDVPGPSYRMHVTIDAPEGFSAADTVRRIEAANFAARTVTGASLRNIVINCHGSAGMLWVGGDGKASIDQSNVGLFANLKPLNVGTLWLVACRAADGPKGQAFCQALASAAGALVIASDDDQEVTAWQTYRYYVGLPGQIDDFEGLVYSFTPLGGMRRGVDPKEAAWTIRV